MTPKEVLAAILMFRASLDAECPFDGMDVIISFNDERVLDTIWAAMDHGIINLMDLGNLTLKAKSAAEKYILDPNIDTETKRLKIEKQSKAFAGLYFIGAWNSFRNGDYEHALMGIERGTPYGDAGGRLEMLKFLCEQAKEGNIVDPGKVYLDAETGVAGFQEAEVTFSGPGFEHLRTLANKNAEINDEWANDDL